MSEILLKSRTEASGQLGNGHTFHDNLQVCTCVVQEAHENDGVYSEVQNCAHYYNTGALFGTLEGCDLVGVLGITGTPDGQRLDAIRNSSGN